MHDLGVSVYDNVDSVVSVISNFDNINLNQREHILQFIQQRILQAILLLNTEVVVDVLQPPTITFSINPHTINAILDENSQEYTSTIGVLAIDSENTTLSVSIIQENTNVVKSVLGTYSVLYYASDQYDNTVQNYRTVVVDDLESPIIELINNNPYTIEARLEEYIDSGINITDNYYNRSDITITTNNNVVTSVPGTYTVSYYVTDPSDNVSNTLYRSVLVKDTTRPVISVLNENPYTIQPSYTYEDLETSIYDLADPNVIVNVNTNNVISSEQGTYTVIYTATDQYNNIAHTKYRTVIVQGDSGPLITFPTNPHTININMDENQQEYTNIAGVTAIDLIDGNRQVSIVQSTNNIVKSQLGTYSVMYSASDLSGNVTNEYRTIVVSDIERPNITLEGQSISTIEAVISDYIDLGVNIIDNYDEEPIAYTVGMVHSSIPNTYTIQYFAIDNHQNTSHTVYRTVVVQDTTGPIISITNTNPRTIEASFTEYSDLAVDITDIGDSNVTVDRNIDNVIVSSIGTYTVVYTATDKFGNASNTVYRTVVIEDNTGPISRISG